MRPGLIRMVRACVAGGKRRSQGAILHADDELAIRGEPDCITQREAMGLVASGAAVRPEDEYVRGRVGGAFAAQN